MKPFYQDKHRTLYCKDCRAMLELDDNSIHAVCTSPPYWGLRKYTGDQELIWGGQADCQHKWGELQPVADGVKTRWTHNPTSKRDTRIIGLGPATCSLCGAWRGAFGLETTPELYIKHSVEILREVRRVLRPDGVVFWNIGDSYWGGKGQSSYAWSLAHPDRKTFQKPYHHPSGAHGETRPSDGKHNIIKPLDLCLIPERLAIALQEDGWWVRSIIIWHKANPMPESVQGWRWERHRIKVKRKSGKYWASNSPHQLTEWQDCPGCPKCSPNDGYILRKGSWRPTDSYEQILMLTKSSSYYCDAEAVREIGVYPRGEIRTASEDHKEFLNDSRTTHGLHAKDWIGNGGRNLRNVWSFPTMPYSGAHFAVFPEKLPELCIKAATPEVGVCAKCGAPWARVTERVDKGWDGSKYGENAVAASGGAKSGGTAMSTLGSSHGQLVGSQQTLGWRPTCPCNCPDTVPATVLDPFAGAGTTLKVGAELGRHVVGYEISREYCRMIVKRNKQQVLI